MSPESLVDVFREALSVIVVVIVVTVSWPIVLGYSL